MSLTSYTPTFAVQVDLETFPATDVLDITDDAHACDIDLNIDADNASCTVQLHALNGSVAQGLRLYIYGNGSLIFNGAIPPGGINYNADETYTLVGQGTMAKMRNKWGGADRTYDAGSGDTDTSTAQNWVEASGIDVSLTSIVGEDRLIGNLQDVVIRGGDLDINGEPTENDSMLEALRLLDKSVIPNHTTFETGAGVVTRLPREIGSSVASYADGGGVAWGFDHQGVPNSIINKWLIKGLTFLDVPTEATASATNALLTAPFEYASDEFSSYFVDDDTWAQDLADWKLADTNGVLRTVSWTTALDNANRLCKTVTVTSARRALSSTLVLVTSLRHHIDGGTATTTFGAEYRV